MSERGLNYSDLVNRDLTSYRGDIGSFALRGWLHQFAHVVEIAAGATYYYSFTVASDKELILFSREFAVSQGPVEVATVSVPTSYTPGDPIFVMNCWTSKALCGSSFTSNATDVVGGFEVIPEYLDGGDAKTAGYSQAGGIVILDRGSEGLIRVTNNSVQASVFRLFLLFGEADLANVS